MWGDNHYLKSLEQTDIQTLYQDLGLSISQPLSCKL